MTAEEYDSLKKGDVVMLNGFVGVVTEKENDSIGLDIQICWTDSTDKYWYSKDELLNAEKL